jgi:predicted ATP-dependent serine protease
MLLNTADTKFAKCSSIEIPDSFFNRMTTGCDEIDLMFGTQYLKGFMPSSTISITGTPGAGKSTFLVAVTELLENTGKRAAIATGEESIGQLAYACKRLGAKNVDIAHCKDVEDIADAMENYHIMVVDSFQSLRSRDTKLKKRAFLQYAQDLLISKAKETECVLVFVLHITTTGLPKGGTDIIHAVDVNMKITVDPDDTNLRIFDVYKNRCGETKKHTAVMGANGFDFQGVYVEPVKETKPKGRGKPVADEYKDKILDIDSPHITLDHVMSKLGIGGQTAGNLLRELVGEKKIEKYGRGADACWKIVNSCNEIYKTYKKLKK